MNLRIIDLLLIDAIDLTPRISDSLKEYLTQRREKRTMKSKWKKQKRYLKAIVCPRSKFEDARLLVEGEVLDVDLARRFVDRRRFPFDEAVVVHRGLRRQRHFKVAVRTANSIITIVPFHSSFIHFNYRRFFKI